MISGMRRKLSYANVMSTVAVFLAIGGGAYAATQIKSNQVKNNSLRSVDLKDDKAVKGEDVIGDSLGGSDILESSLAEVPRATTATTATTATNGIRAYALLNADGTVDTGAPNSGITNANVSHVALSGVYCFNGLSFAPKGLSVVGDTLLGNAQDNFFSASVSPKNNGSCTGAEQASIESQDDDPNAGAAVQDAEFYIVFY